MSSYPTDLRYTDNDEWVRPGETPVTLGITQAAAERLGTVSFVELPYPGELFKPGALLGRVSSAGGSMAIRMPFVGQINAVNSALGDAPGLVSDDPYGEGWIVRIEPGDPADAEALLDADAYAASLSSRDD